MVVLLSLDSPPESVVMRSSFLLLLVVVEVDFVGDDFDFVVVDEVVDCGDGLSLLRNELDDVLLLFFGVGVALELVVGTCSTCTGAAFVVVNDLED